MIQVEIPTSPEVAAELERMQSALWEVGFVMDTEQPPVRIGTKGSLTLCVARLCSADRK
jgi:hypothetical protein